MLLEKVYQQEQELIRGSVPAKDMAIKLQEQGAKKIQGYASM
jgi:hypothetical protein